jgi:hypothetical protein
MNPAVLIADIAKLASKLPAPVLLLVKALIRAIATSDDPARAALRAAKAVGAKAAIDAALRQTLKR